MMDMDWEEIHVSSGSEVPKILADILNTDNIDFVAYAMSKWHAIGVDAALTKVLSDKKRSHGIIVISEHSKDGFILNPVDFTSISKFQTKIVYAPALRSMPNVFESLALLADYLAMIYTNIAHQFSRTLRRTLYIVSPSQIAMSFLLAFSQPTLVAKYSPRLVIIDEGIGSYISERLRSIIIRLDNSTQNRGDISPLHLKGAEWMRAIAERIFPSEKRLLCQRKSGILIPNWEVIDSYRLILNQHVSDFGTTAHPSSTGIILTQPFSECDQIDGDTEFRVLEQIVRELWRFDLDVIVKPHPREKKDKYQSFVKRLKRERSLSTADKALLAERLFSSVRPQCVVGYMSTSLLTAALLYGIPAFSASRLLLSQNVGPLILEGAREFSKLTKGIIHEFTRDQLVNVLQSP